MQSELDPAATAGFSYNHEAMWRSGDGGAQRSPTASRINFDFTFASWVLYQEGPSVLVTV